jgi:hypothetical protein
LADDLHRQAASPALYRRFGSGVAVAGGIAHYVVRGDERAASDWTHANYPLDDVAVRISREIEGRVETGIG